MKYIIQKDKSRRSLFSKNETTRILLKSIVNNKILPTHHRIEASMKLSSMPYNSSIVRIKNRCVKTGRSRAVYRFFKVCRHVLRNQALDGLLPGITKSTW